MCAITVSVELDARAPQRLSVGKRTQQLVMARAGFVDSREERIDHSQAARRVDALRGKAFASMHESIP